MKAILSAIVVVAGVTTSAAALELTSPDIKDRAQIAKEQVYTRCGGSNISPALSWSGAPAGTRSFALTAIDLSVTPNDWSHWIVIDLSPMTASLGKGAALPAGARPVMTDFGEAVYNGPCPPAGSGVHQYQFTVWALSTPSIHIPEHATATQMMAILQKNAVAKASITATYQR